MRLISCHIDGFGKIVNQSFDFTDGLNTILEENGWGKTTFSVFVKAMFFGMEYAPRKKTLTEREHYSNWQGASYGGSIDFELSDRRYRIERSFARKDKDDTFALIDLDTMRNSQDYSSNIGEEIFGVDQESFEKSIYVPQAAVETAMTDSLNAKMGDLSTAKNDISRFDKAVASLEEAKKRYTQTSKVNPGIMIQLTNKIKACNARAEEIPALTSGYEKQEILLDEKRHQLNEAEVEKRKLAEAITTQSRKEQEYGAYQEQLKAYQQYQTNQQELEKYFAELTPSQEEMNEYEQKERDLEGNRKQYEQLEGTLPPVEQQIMLQNLFREHELTEEDLLEYNSGATRIKQLRAQGEQLSLSQTDREQYQELALFFSKKQPTEEELDAAQTKATELANIDGQLKLMEETYHQLNAQAMVSKKQKNRQTSSTLYVMLIVLSVILLLGGAVFLLALPGLSIAVILAVVCFVLAAGVMAGAILGMLNHKKEVAQSNMVQESDVLEAKNNWAKSLSQKEKIMAECQEFLADYLVTPTDDYQQMVNEIRSKATLYLRLVDEEKRLVEHSSQLLEELSELQVRIYTSLSHYATVYEMDLFTDGNESELIQKLTADWTRYQSMQEALEQKEKLGRMIEQLSLEMHDFIAHFPREEGKANEVLSIIRLKLSQYETVCEKTASLKSQLEAFEEQYKIHETTESVEQLQAKQNELDTTINELNQMIAQEKDKLSQLSEELDSASEEADLLDGLQEELAEANEKVSIYDLTLTNLHKAKDNFLRRYMGPLRDGLRDYMHRIDPDYDETQEDFSIDMDLAIKVKSGGKTSSGEYLSAAYQDLAALCIRFALVEVLYVKEKPVLILDDPFTNFDEKKIRAALHLLEDVSKDYQILYFTCHKSRVK